MSLYCIFILAPACLLVSGFVCCTVLHELRWLFSYRWASWSRSSLQWREVCHRNRSVFAANLGAVASAVCLIRVTLIWIHLWELIDNRLPLPRQCLLIQYHIRRLQNSHLLPVSPYKFFINFVDNGIAHITIVVPSSSALLLRSVTVCRCTCWYITEQLRLTQVWPSQFE